MRQAVSAPAEGSEPLSSVRRFRLAVRLVFPASTAHPVAFITPRSAPNDDHLTLFQHRPSNMRVNALSLAAGLALALANLPSALAWGAAGTPRSPQSSRSA